MHQGATGKVDEFRRNGGFKAEGGWQWTRLSRGDWTDRRHQYSSVGMCSELNSAHLIQPEAPYRYSDISPSISRFRLFFFSWYKLAWARNCNKSISIIWLIFRTTTHFSVYLKSEGWPLINASQVSGKVLYFPPRMPFHYGRVHWIPINTDDLWIIC